jgi:hypothetical protein
MRWASMALVIASAVLAPRGAAAQADPQAATTQRFV